VDDSAKASLSLDNHIGHTHLTAQCGEEDDELDGLHVVRNNNKGSLLGLDESNRMVETIFGEYRLLRVLLLFPLGSVFCFSVNTGFLFLLGFRTILIEELEKLCSSVFVESV